MGETSELWNTPTDTGSYRDTRGTIGRSEERSKYLGKRKKERAISVCRAEARKHPIALGMFGELLSKINREAGRPTQNEESVGEAPAPPIVNMGGRQQTPGS